MRFYIIKLLDILWILLGETYQNFYRLVMEKNEEKLLESFQIFSDKTLSRLETKQGRIVNNVLM